MLQTLNRFPTTYTLDDIPRGRLCHLYSHDMIATICVFLQFVVWNEVMYIPIECLSHAHNLTNTLALHTPTGLNRKEKIRHELINYNFNYYTDPAFYFDNCNEKLEFKYLETLLPSIASPAC
jgi:hypothetical protein